MHTKDLQNIGDVLYRELSPLKHSSRIKDPEGTGAGGDRTYHIDRLAEEIIISGLESLNEPLTVISEEAGIVHLHGGGKTVLVDPIDGSRNAVHGIPFYGTSIAAAAGSTVGDLYLSYIINLANGDAFWAEKNKKAFSHGNPMHCQKSEEFSFVACEVSIPSRDLQPIAPLLSAARKVRCMGATALDLAYVACGAVSAFVTASASRSFDFAGGFLLIKEAGGIITDMQGNDLGTLELGLHRSTSLLAAGNGALHQKALDLLIG
ncbi:MAG TPA: inositol monophosphatase family protein [Thermodesulfovibrionales bacterium]|nr:inositol monophosphatase family protein [Thermodesulfovibrionales bacterium]